MTRTNNLNQGLKGVAFFIKKNKLLILMTLFFLLGMILGTLTINASDSTIINRMSFLVSSYLDKRIKQPFFTTFCSSFFSVFIYMIITYFLGFCAISTPFIFFVLIFRGLGLGMSMGYLYAYYGIQGMLFCTVMILPTAVISTVILLFASRDAQRLSVAFSSSFLPSVKTSVTPQYIKKYTVKYFAFTVIIAISSLFDSILISVFGSAFTF